ncbi:MAG: Gfo/Idh/MocA family oxidoreductase [Clostridia bacterium]|nr:Gfo/Idh/MocA family oxidoreductase [Clostridia bacterium]
MKQKIRIAQIGAGHDHAGDVFKTLRRLTDEFEVVGYAPVPEDGGVLRPDCYEGATAYDVDTLLSIPDLDAVAVETFDLALVPYAQKAAEKGLSVYMDKPGSEDAESFERMLSTVKAHGRVFGIGYLYRCNRGVQAALQTAREGKIGRVYAVEAQMNCDYTYDKRQWLARFKGGMAFYLGSHLVDLIHAFMGVPDEIIPCGTRTGLFGTTSLDYGFAVFRYGDGLSFLNAAMTEPGGFERRQLVVCGELGTLELRPLEWYVDDTRLTTVTRSCIRPDPAELYPWPQKGEITRSAPATRYEALLRDFAARVRTGKMPDGAWEREARVHRMLLAACGLPCDYKAPISL